MRNFGEIKYLSKDNKIGRQLARESAPDRSKWTAKPFEERTIGLQEA
jgi:hypothetical protein